MLRLTVVFLTVAAGFGIGGLILKSYLPAGNANKRAGTLSQTYLSLHTETPLQVPQLISSDGGAFQAGRLQGHWSLVFFGYTACPLVCPQTLSALSAVARNRESGVADGNTLPIFISVDPAHDTPQQVSSYLSHFDKHILGLTGSSEDIRRFSRELGAGYQPAGASIDHSTSLFVVDPKGRLAGVLLHPSRPAQIISDLEKLRHAYADGETR